MSDMIAARDLKLESNNKIVKAVEESISKTIKEGRQKLIGVDPFKLARKDKSPD